MSYSFMFYVVLVVALFCEYPVPFLSLYMMLSCSDENYVILDVICDYSHSVGGNNTDVFASNAYNVVRHFPILFILLLVRTSAGASHLKIHDITK